ncbi:phage head morphogenesis protein [Paraburkholderia fungorum]|uniref:phage head morphogenesis protein n=1 Tax=Paraburkholderia fungorum TaxID=134537 RepID=UPI0038B99E26
MAKLVSPTGKDIALRPVRANAGIEAAYKKQLDRWIDAMHKSLVWWISAQYRANPPPSLAQDAGFESFRDGSPANAMRRAIHRMSRRWMKAFDKGADDLAKYFVDKAAGATDVQLKDILKKAGFTVQFKTTAEVNNAMQAAIGENVGLIKSIASEHLSQVEGTVMRHMQTGRDIGALTKDLTERYDITKKRAAFIARDQANKMTAVINRTRQNELGITQARWKHSGAGKHPRLSHLAAGRDNGGKGVLYDVAKGCLIDDEYIWPGQLPNCRCTSQSVIPGLGD